ncbi:MAG: succinate dehydrogenase assembly factor 2 [Caulobacteraceae bacterium]
MDETRIRKVRFRAWRRGLLEADLILGPFADLHARNLDESELTAFERLLEEGDDQLLAWVSGSAPPPSSIEASLAARLRAFAHSRPKENAR